MTVSARTTYPDSSLENPAELQSTMGTFWRDVFADQDSLQALLDAKLQQAQLNWASVQRLADCRSRLSLPLYREEPLYPLSLSATAPVATPRYGQGEEYGDGTLLGTPVTGPFEQTIGNGFLGCPLITDNAYSPNRILVEGLDYQQQSDGRLHCLEVLDGTYHAWQAFFDDRLPWLFLGAVTGIGLPTSQQALDLYQAVADASINGPSEQTLADCLAALAGCSVQAVGEETVEDIADDSRGQLIATDQRIYRVPAGATVLVSVGQYLRGGENLSDAVQLVTPQDLPAEVSSVTVPAVHLDPSLTEPVIFEVAATALTVTENVDGKTRLSWSGAGAGGTAFFDLLHARGVADDQTLANYLDVRADPTDEPTAASLPATLSPFDLLCQTVWQTRNILLLFVKPALLESTLETDWNEVLRRVLQPHAAVLRSDL